MATEEPLEPEWVSQAEAARRLGMSETWFARIAEEIGITVERQGPHPGVDWKSVEKWIVRARVAPGAIQEHPQRKGYRRQDRPNG
jgi:hypothetical protein